MSGTLIDAYLNRIGVRDAPRPDLAGLTQLHEAHAASIPFENLDILLGRGTRLDIDSLRAKLIDARRGGYCFEQNTLFGTILSSLGFEVQTLEARVRTNTTAVRPRTHMVLAVTIDGRAWLADVGFGGEGPIEPVPMDGTESDAVAGLRYRVVSDGELQVLQMRGGLQPNVWVDQYAFLQQAVHPVDFEMANWFTSTYPQSPFVRTLTAQRSTRDARWVLRYPSWTTIREHELITRELGRHELIDVLREVFTIALPRDTVFPAIDDQPSALACSSNH
jgi:N-hydroxyarylamine O-acetyltransferase